MDRYERFVASYLRLNGYFTVPNFIVHAADDPTRKLAEHVGNVTETDILGVRMPHSHEVSGRLHIANDPQLVDGSAGRFDVVIAEVKSGKGNTPNRVWRGSDSEKAATYIARFVGLHKEEDELTVVGQALPYCPPSELPFRVEVRAAERRFRYAP